MKTALIQELNQLNSVKKIKAEQLNGLLGDGHNGATDENIAAIYEMIHLADRGQSTAGNSEVHAIEESIRGTIEEKVNCVDSRNYGFAAAYLTAKQEGLDGARALDRAVATFDEDFYL